MLKRIPKSFMTIDPGDNTGWSLWENKKLIKSGMFKSKFHEFEEVRLLEMHRQFSDLISVQRLLFPYAPIDVVYIEGVSVWGGSMKSVNAATSGRLTRLFYVVGVYMSICWSYKNIRPEVIYPQRWKGQMDKKAVAMRVYRVLKKTFKTDHETDAVGMGLHVIGKL